MIAIDQNSLLYEFKKKLYQDILGLDKLDLEPEEYLQYRLSYENAMGFVEWALEMLDKSGVDTTLPVKYKIISTFLKFYAPIIENEDEFFTYLDKKSELLYAKIDGSTET